MVNGRYEKRFSCGSSIEGVVEPELGRVTRPELADLLGGVRLGRAHLLGCLGVNGVELLPVGFYVRGTNVTAKHAGGNGALPRFDKHLQVGQGIRVAADFGQKKRIDAAARGDQIEVAADTGLRRMHVA